MASGKTVVRDYFFFLVSRFIDVCILCLAIYLRSIPHKLPSYIKVPKGREKPLPKKFDWRDKKVIADVRNQQTVSPGVFPFLVLKHCSEIVPAGTSYSTVKVLEGTSTASRLFQALAE